MPTVIIFSGYSNGMKEKHREITARESKSERMAKPKNKAKAPLDVNQGLQNNGVLPFACEKISFE